MIGEQENTLTKPAHNDSDSTKSIHGKSNPYILENESKSIPEISRIENNEVRSESKEIMKTAGRWTEEEHKKFMEAYELYGKDWKLVQNYIGTRSAAQARSLAQKYFAKVVMYKNVFHNKTQTDVQIISPMSNPSSNKELD